MKPIISESLSSFPTSDSTKNTTTTAPPPQPWGTHFLDLLRLLSPRTWWGLAQNVEKSPFVSIDWSPLWEGVRGLLLPWLLACLLLHQQPTLYWASPWGLHCGWSFVQPVRQLVQVGILNRRLAAPALPQAVDCIWDMVHQQRAVRTRRYDLFLPHNTTQPQRAILFVPGAAVPTIAYAPIAARLANAGYVVVIPSMEPFRLALHHLGAEWSSIRRIMRRVERQLGYPCEWILAGHSMGSFAALCLFVTSQRQRHSISNQLVLWGTMYSPAYAKSLRDTNVDLLLIQGSHDVLLELTGDCKDEFETKCLPERYRKRVLEGGTHHGFASYKAPTPDRPEDLTRAQQQELACRESLLFLQQQHHESKKRPN